MMGEFQLGNEIIIRPVYDKTGEWVGSIECWNTEAREFASFYTADNRLARRFDIQPYTQFWSLDSIMGIINSGGK